MAERDLFDLLGVAQLELPYASLVAWLLNPSADHERGDALVRRLRELLADRDLSWDPSPSTPAEVSMRGEEQVVLVPGEPPLVVAHRLHRTGSLELNLHAGEQLVCLGGPRSFPQEVAGRFPEPVTIRFAYPRGGAYRKDYELLVEEFAEIYPHITVELVTQSWRGMANVNPEQVDVFATMRSVEGAEELGEASCR